MITLLADGPQRPEIAQFGRLVGLWRTEITRRDDDDRVRRAEGDWEFGYALEGRAVIDVWQVPSRRALGGAPRAAGQECGLCVRIWDPRLQLWRFTFHGTARCDLIHMFGREVGGEIVLEGAEPGRLVRWIFSDVRPRTFSWRSERSHDGGAGWHVEQEVRARRATGDDEGGAG